MLIWGKPTGPKKEKGKRKKGKRNMENCPTQKEKGKRNMEKGIRKKEYGKPIWVKTPCETIKGYLSLVSQGTAYGSQILSPFTILTCETLPHVSDPNLTKYYFTFFATFSKFDGSCWLPTFLHSISDSRIRAGVTNLSTYLHVRRTKLSASLLAE